MVGINKEIKTNYKYPRGEPSFWVNPFGWVRGVVLRGDSGQRTIPGSGVLYELIQIGKIPKHRVRLWTDFRLYTNATPADLNGYILIMVDQVKLWFMQSNLSYQNTPVPPIGLVQPENSKATIYMYFTNSALSTRHMTFSFSCLEFHDDWDLGRGTGLDNPAVPPPVIP